MIVNIRKDNFLFEDTVLLQTMKDIYAMWNAMKQEIILLLAGGTYRSSRIHRKYCDSRIM